MKTVMPLFGAQPCGHGIILFFLEAPKPQLQLPGCSFDFDVNLNRFGRIGTGLGN